MKSWQHIGRGRPGVSGVGWLAPGLVVWSGLLIAWSGTSTEPRFDAPRWTWLAVVAAYWLSERSAFQVEFRGDVMSLSLSQAPTAFALAFLGPIPAIAAYVLGSLFARSRRRRPPWPTTAFAASVLAFEMALAFTVVDALVGSEPIHEGRFLLSSLVAIAVATVVDSVSASVVAVAGGGDFVDHLGRQFRTGLVVWPVIATLAVMSVAPAMFGVEYAMLSIVPIAAVWFGFVRAGRLAQRYADLEALHGFTGVVAGSLHLADFVPAALEETRRILHADRAVLQVYGDSDDSPMTWASGPQVGHVPLGTQDERFHDVVAIGRPSLCTFGPDGGIVLAGADAIVAPLADADGVLGVLIVADRNGANDTFEPADLHLVVTLSDQLRVSLRKALLHSTMEFAAMHDALTGDLNRAAFEQAVTDELGQPHSQESSAVLMLDLDEFKEVNDTLGHHVGDQVLIEFTERVHGLLEPGDVFGRFGGDEFVVFAHRFDLDEIRDLAESIVSASHAPLQLGGRDVVVPASVGIAVVGEYDTDASTCLRRADIAMYNAKKHHVGFEVYREEFDRRTPDRLALLGDLRRALDTGELTVHFQPKVDIATSTVVGAETLARWKHPRRGLVMPHEFIAVAEATGLIRMLTDQVVDAAVRAAREWSDAGYDLTVAVNISTLDLLDELLAERIAHRLEQHEVDPARLTIEITESSLMADTPRAMTMIDRLHRLGVKLSLDDFGTGFSSLSYLRRLPVTELKIDRTFVSNLLVDTQDDVIVTSTIDLGHNLGLDVVAEGIECERVLGRLRALGCDLGQGYGISRPMASDQFVGWLGRSSFEVLRCGGVANAPVDGGAPVR